VNAKRSDRLYREMGFEPPLETPKRPGKARLHADRIEATMSIEIRAMHCPTGDCAAICRLGLRA
jgi:hypothetical protein